MVNLVSDELVNSQVWFWTFDMPAKRRNLYKDS